MHFANYIRMLLAGLSLAALLVIPMSCLDNEVDIPDKPLAGLIDGEEWTYEFASSTPFSATTTATKYQFYLFSSEELNAGPCGTGSSSNPYIEVVLPIQIGSYSLPLSQPIENLRFAFGNGAKLAATSGFIEILALDNRRMAGYIQALVDENNIVEGRFIAELCF